jgi:hypothetical protein
LQYFRAAQHAPAGSDKLRALEAAKKWVGFAQLALDRLRAEVDRRAELRHAACSTTQRPSEHQPAPVVREPPPSEFYVLLRQLERGRVANLGAAPAVAPEDRDAHLRHCVPPPPEFKDLLRILEQADEC